MTDVRYDGYDVGVEPRRDPRRRVGPMIRAGGVITTVPEAPSTTAAPRGIDPEGGPRPRPAGAGSRALRAFNRMLADGAAAQVLVTRRSQAGLREPASGTMIARADHAQVAGAVGAPTSPIATSLRARQPG